MFKKSFLLFSAFLILACKSHPVDEIDKTDIAVGTLPERELYEITKNIQITPIKDNSKFGYIGEIYRVIPYQDYLILFYLDFNSRARSIVITDDNGNIQNIITSLNEGSDYSFLGYAADISVLNNKLYVFCPFKQKIVTCNLPDLEINGEYQSNIEADQFIVTNNYIYYYGNNNYNHNGAFYNCIVADWEGNILNKFVTPLPGLQSNKAFGTNMSSSGASSYLWQSFDYNIYQIQEYKIKIAKSIDFGNLGIDNALLERCNNQTLDPIDVFNNFEIIGEFQYANFINGQYFIAFALKMKAIWAFMNEERAFAFRPNSPFVASNIIGYFPKWYDNNQNDLYLVLMSDDFTYALENAPTEQINKYKSFSNLDSYPLSDLKQVRQIIVRLKIDPGKIYTN